MAPQGRLQVLHAVAGLCLQRLTSRAAPLVHLHPFDNRTTSVVSALSCQIRVRLTPHRGGSLNSRSCWRKLNAGCAPNCSAACSCCVHLEVSALLNQCTFSASELYEAICRIQAVTRACGYCFVHTYTIAS